MENNKNLILLLELINQPAFCVKDGFVLSANSEAEKCMIHAGMNIADIITQNRNIFDAFHGGELFITITAGGLPYNARIARTEEFDIFTIEQSEEDCQLQALALAAQQLRIPLSNIMALSDRVLSCTNPDDSNVQQQIGQINRNMLRMQRIITNMSDAGSYKYAITEGKQTVNFTAFFGETIEKVQTISKSAGKELIYSGPNTAIFGLADEEKLGRAIYNLLSNALKFSPAESTVEAKLTSNRNLLSFTVTNKSTDPASDSSFQNRYSRKPAIEDDRFGLGLGMTLISSTACAHGGTVLIDHPTADSTRVTMTIAIIKDDKGLIRSPIFRIGDYAGELDKCLLELSEILPADIYKDIN